MIHSHKTVPGPRPATDHLRHAAEQADKNGLHEVARRRRTEAAHWQDGWANAKQNAAREASGT